MIGMIVTTYNSFLCLNSSSGHYRMDTEYLNVIVDVFLCIDWWPSCGEHYDLMVHPLVRSAKTTGGLMPTDPPWSRPT